ncbi:MAG: extracellular solute-binding protein [Acidaminococcaceae bacterium]|nr:extracellular solute-binding protein [Acidaminococcaceae bacterium]
MKRFCTGIAAFMLAVGMLAAGCGGTEQNAKKEQKAAAKPVAALTVYTSVYNGMVKDMAKPVVEQQLKDVKVDWRTEGSEKVKERIHEELNSGKAKADIVMISDPGFYLQLKKDGKLLNYKSPEAAELAEAVDVDGAFTPIRISAMVIAVHNDKIKEPPKSWKDLLDPKYKGKIAMPDPKVAATALSTVAALTNKYGWEYWQKLKANGVVVSKTSEMREKFAKGEYPITITMEENVLKQKATQGVNATVVYPEEGSILVPGYIAIMKDTVNPEGAKKLVDWWLSKEGQSAMSLAYMHPVKYGVREPAGAQDINNLRIHSLSVNWNKLAVEEKIVKDKFAEIMK